MEIAVGMHQDQGKREYQQDTMSIKPFSSIGGVLAILADGMGGYEGGEIASQIVSDNLREFTIEGDDIGEALKKYLIKGNDAIAEYKKEHVNVKNMGTTAIAFFMTDKNCQWVSVGDSPLYVIRNRSIIKRINENHSVAGLLDLQVKKGVISQEEALSSGQRHMLTSAVSGDNLPQIDKSVSWSIKNNDIFILASDGIETITEDRIKEIVIGLTASGITQENVQKACEALVEDVLDQGTKNQDNVTVIILAKIIDGEPETAIYNGPGLDFMGNKKLPLSIIAGAVISVLTIVLVWFFLSSGESKSIPIVDKNQTIKNIDLKQQKAIVKTESNVSKKIVTHASSEQYKTVSVAKDEQNLTTKSNDGKNKSEIEKIVQNKNKTVKKKTKTRPKMKDLKIKKMTDEMKRELEESDGV